MAKKTIHLGQHIPILPKGVSIWVPNRFFGIRDLAYFKAGIRDLAILTGGNREMSLLRNRDSGIPETEICKENQAVILAHLITSEPEIVEQ